MTNHPKRALCVLEFFLNEIYENSSSRIQKKDRNGTSGCEFCQKVVRNISGHMMSLNGEGFRPLSTDKGTNDQEDNTSKSACCSLLPTGNIAARITIGEGGTLWILREYDCPIARGEILLSKIGFSYEAKFHLCDNVKRHDVGV